jgi:hypothetical protein
VAPSLAALGLESGERVRFRRREGGRWHQGVVRGLEGDGSLAISDEKGAARALPLDRVEVAAPGPRGARGWEPVAERAARTEQMRLL